MASIMVADDIKSIRELLYKFLTDKGHNVIEAENGNEVIEKLQDTEIDLLIIDILMPEKEGIETILELKDHDFPIIAISGGGQYSADRYLNYAKKLGADYTIEKPFSPKKLYKKIEKLLS